MRPAAGVRRRTREHRTEGDPVLEASERTPRRETAAFSLPDRKPGFRRSRGHIRLPARPRLFALGSVSGLAVFEEHGAAFGNVGLQFVDGLGLGVHTLPARHVADM